MRVIKRINYEAIVVQTLFVLSNSSYANASDAAMHVIPQTIGVNITDNQLARLPPLGLLISSNSSIAKVVPQFTDLQSSQHGKAWISRNNVSSMNDEVMNDYMLC